jgi:decaprenylphospho-beta-D-ribofuranose 2-oxidase
MSTGINSQLISFDGSTSAKSDLIRPDRYDFFSDARNFPGKAIARGAGLSYTAASFAEGSVSIEHGNFDRIIDFNEQEQWIEVETGITLGQLYDFLIERNLFLATQPGHPRISVGGCIAPDIHGKNQFLDGTFINQVISLKLFHPSHGVIELSAQENPDLFRLTCGAYGLTGNIISCKLKLKKVPSSMAQVSLIPLSSIDELPVKLRESAACSDFVLSWHDFTLSGKNFGKGFVQQGRFIEAPQDSSINNKKAADQTLDARSRGILPVPVFNPITVKMMNMLYGSRCKGSGSQFTMSLFDSIFPIQNSKELYFKFFGAAGFHEYQVVIPEQNFKQYINGVKQYLSKNSLPITLASAKLFAGKQDFLRFTGDGICFAINFARSRASLEFMAELDRLVLECGGIPNIIKDSRLSQSVVAAAYPEYEKFRTMLREFDPDRFYRSELSERLAL